MRFFYKKINKKFTTYLKNIYLVEPNTMQKFFNNVY